MLFPKKQLDTSIKKILYDESNESRMPGRVFSCRQILAFEWVAVFQLRSKSSREKS